MVSSVSLRFRQIRGLANLSPQFFVGTFAVLVGFVLETMAEEDEKEGEADGEPADVEGDPASRPHERLLARTPQTAARG